MDELFRPEVARPLLAGWIAGAFVGLLDTALVVIAVSRSPRWPEQLSHFRVSLPAFTIAAANGMLLGWTLVGLLLGAFWIIIPMPRFAIAVCAVTFAVAGLYAYVRGLDDRGEATVVLSSLALATFAFAGALPVLAAWD